MKASTRGIRPPADPKPAYYCTLGDTLCRVHFWTEAEWNALPTNQKSAQAVHKPGSGWIAPVPVHGLS